jgi:NAD(P)H-dependent FMN reductase
MRSPVRILGIAGSLRRDSFNRPTLRAASELAPEGASIESFELDGIPGFNEDDEHNPPRQGRRTEAARTRSRCHSLGDAGIQLLYPRRAEERD